MNNHKLLLVVGVLLVVLGFMVGYTASALTPSLVQPASVQVLGVQDPTNSSTSLGYSLGYVVEVYRNNILEMSADYVNNTVGITHLANLGSVSILYNLGYGLASESYAQGLTANGSIATVIDPTPDVITTTTTVYNETTTTQTVTTTWVTTTTVVQDRTYTITSPVPLAPTTVTVEGGGGFPAGLALAGIGLVLLVLAGLLVRKG